jgi:GxxExxY protein
MQMDEGDARLLEPVTERIIGCAFRVANTLGHGFAEKVYENALAHEMRSPGSAPFNSGQSSSFMTT